MSPFAPRERRLSRSERRHSQPQFARRLSVDAAIEGCQQPVEKGDSPSRRGRIIRGNLSSERDSPLFQQAAGGAEGQASASRLVESKGGMALPRCPISILYP